MPANGKNERNPIDQSPVSGVALPLAEAFDASRADANAAAVELAEMVAAQRSVVERDIQEDSVSATERLAHERTLGLLVGQLRHTLLASGGGGLHAALHSAGELADLLVFEPLKSHRSSSAGRAVSAAKTAFLQGLKPFHFEMLRPQTAFDHALVRAFRDVIEARKSGAARPELAQDLEDELATLTNPVRWRIDGHRRGAAGRAIGSLKRLYLRGARPLLQGVFERQQRWNELAVKACGLAARKEVTTDASRALLAELRSLTDPFETLPPSPTSRFSQPFWREVFRRQQRFNAHILSLLGELLGVVVPSLPVDYTAWCTEREPSDIRRAAKAAEALRSGPRFSIVTPVYNTPEPFLRACVESVRAQSYARWELILVDDRSPDPGIGLMLHAFAAKDARIRIVSRGENGGIAKATNAGMAEARGDYVCFLDHDDTLAPHALAEYALKLHAEPALDVLYSDEDKLDLNGTRVDPFFKPDFAPDTLRACNYICHFLAVRRTLADAAGRLKEGFDGAQDFEFLLRLTERTKNIGHVPKVLYHWRMAPNSTALNILAKPEATDAGVRALRQHLARLGEEGTVESPLPTNYRIRYPTHGNPKVSIIVPHKDKVELTRAMVESLVAHTRYPNWELILISNNSVQPETFQYLDTLTDPRIQKLTWDQRFNWSAVNNFGVQHASGELFLFLNNDIVLIEDGWLDELVGQGLRREVGAVGPKLIFPNGTIQEAGVVVGMGGMAGHTFVGLPANTWTPFGHSHWTRNYLAVTGACLLVRRDSFESIGGFDERFIVCGSDIDLCLRLTERGLRTVYTPHATAIHDESSTRRTDSIPEQDFYESFRAYGKYLDRGDPYYNPNLSLWTGDGTLRTDARNGRELAAEVLSNVSQRAPTSWVPNPRLNHQRDVAGMLSTVDYSRVTMAQARAQQGAKLAALRSKKLERVTWLIPGFKHPYGGIHTILRFGQLLRDRHGVQSHYVVYDSPQGRASDFVARTRSLFEEPPGTFEILKRNEDVERLPECDLSIATFWTSAYLVLRHQRATAHGYFIQDFEPLFYPAGTLYGLSEQTYRLGLFGIFNTRGLHDYVTRNYDMKGVWFEPAVDEHIFHAERPARTGPVRVFFYGRPAADRNAFELGITSLKKLKAQLGEAVQIISAGEPWDPGIFGVKGVIENLGVLPYSQTAELYRTCDVGLVFMFTKHPSYLPFELMASGVSVVTNENSANTWLLKHEENCLLTEPTVSAVTEQLVRAVRDPDLRTRLSAAAVLRVRLTTWPEQVDRVHRALSAEEEAVPRSSTPLHAVPR